MLSRHSELVTAGYLLTWRTLEPASGAGLGLALLGWLASSHGRVCPAAPLSSLPVTHGKAQPGTPGAEFLSVTKSDGVPINIFLWYFENSAFWYIGKFEELFSSRLFFFFFFPTVILNKSNESALIYGNFWSAETTVLVSFVRSRAWMRSFHRLQVPAGVHFLHQCTSWVVKQMSEFEQTSYLKQTPQKGIKMSSSAGVNRSHK